MTYIRSIGRILMLVAAGSTAGVALAQGPGYWQGQGGGPGYGPGYGRGMGPGMMGGYAGQGHGPGMGPGMMGHHGHGPGRGPGTMRGRWERMAHALGLSEDQRAKVGRIMEDTRRKNWDVLGQIQSERFKLREMVRGDKVDPNAAVEQKGKVDDLKRQVMRSRLEARNQVLALLTPEQREKARALGQQRWAGRGNG
jgi:Spy/CpxP family protein refolding chaperone